MTTVTTVAIATVCSVWLALSVVNQIQRGRFIARVKRHDVLALIPTWTFFAPRPGVTDFHVMYRDCSASGGASRWREVDTPRSRWWRSFWNPSKRPAKGLTDTCNTLLRLARADLGTRIYLQLPYLMLLNYVTAAPRTAASDMRQFAIVRTTGCDAPRATSMLFVSALHRI